VILVDTSIWIDVLRDSERASIFQQKTRHYDLCLSRFNQLELLQGVRNETEWQLLSRHLDTQIYLEMNETSWIQAARLYFDLRRRGLTVRSAVDCCIAQLAIENELPLFHRDRDFEVIAKVSPLQQRYLEW
jgi:predicted nucleic acid-binding protein